MSEPTLAERLEAAERRIAELERALHSSKLALIDYLHLEASHKFSPEDYEDTEQRIDASGSRFSYFADAVEKIDIALSTASNNGWQEMDSAPRDGTEILGFWSYLYAGDKTPTYWMEVISWRSTQGGSGWSNAGDIFRIDSFTHWQPLPPTPQVQL